MEKQETPIKQVLTTEKLHNTSISKPSTPKPLLDKLICVSVFAQLKFTQHHQLEAYAPPQTIKPAIGKHGRYHSSACSGH